MAPNNLEETKQTLQLHDATAPLKIIFYICICVRVRFFFEPKVTFSSLRSHKIMYFAKFGRFLCTNLQLSYALYFCKLKKKKKEIIVIIVIIAKILLLLKLSIYLHRTCWCLVNQMVRNEDASTMSTEYEHFGEFLNFSSTVQSSRDFGIANIIGLREKRSICQKTINNNDYIHEIVLLKRRSTKTSQSHNSKIRDFMFSSPYCITYY